MLTPKQIKDSEECVELDNQGISKNCDTCSCSVCLVDQSQLLHEASIGQAVIKAFKEANAVFSIEPTEDGIQYDIELTSEKELLAWMAKGALAVVKKESEAAK